MTYKDHSIKKKKKVQNNNKENSIDLSEYGLDDFVVPTTANVHSSSSSIVTAGKEDNANNTNDELVDGVEDNAEFDASFEYEAPQYFDFNSNPYEYEYVAHLTLDLCLHLA